ncbi:hypothetical protein HBH70_091380 [Parastagonospora nodorum]|nr:hypothetical protein HBH51_062420 [Parastagonospora nodorum]KAH3999018.1 hypothetical protein HBI10_119060 [Parastagonospora nodorum]KAH4025157.1 hypothetical protein HBI13_078130 [Parastagonospora nodorum]KAH4067791.1 hypothetical protein HBH50_132020 [Parastagonospora nodorum]KAH4086890.1 hypothetical protein HBH48_141440 [Parastagonospora nodorum]
MHHSHRMYLLTRIRRKPALSPSFAHDNLSTLVRCEPCQQEGFYVEFGILYIPW